MKYLFYILALILVLLATSFALLNAQPVDLHYYVGTISFSLSWLLLLSLLIGLILGISILLPAVIRLKYSNRKLRQVVQSYETEIRNLRTFPIQDAQ